MNTYWSELNKQVQLYLTKKNFSLSPLSELRKVLFDEILSFRDKLSAEDFSKAPFINSKGYESKTVAYSLWHIFRIEDIVVNSIIMDREQVFFAGDYRNKTNSPIITTGNELVKQEIADFSKQLNLDGLYDYIFSVYTVTNDFLKTVSYYDLKKKFTNRDKIERLNSVSSAELWLLDYWYSKDLKGLIKMPLSRHLIMHIEASNRIIDKLI